MKIFACHLLNDYSGSPKVLMQLIKGWASEGIQVNVVTCAGKTGFLSDLSDVTYHYYKYKWSANSIIRLINYIISQLFLFLVIMRKAEKKDIIYINTILPFGAAIAGKMKGARVIYHIHETSLKPIILKKFLFLIIKVCASDTIYVSRYISKKEAVQNTRKHVLYNAIEEDFYKKASSFKKHQREYTNVLMVGSLKRYKGVNEFIELAKLNPHLNFKLVLNADKTEIEKFCSEIKPPANVTIYDSQINLHPFYQWADVVLNLSKPDEWIETFGLTMLEAMAYELPTIAPPVGGITEIVIHGTNGFLADSRNTVDLSRKLNLILQDKTTYYSMQTEASLKIVQFREKNFIRHSLQILK